jgi:hypothetical protein
VKIILVLLNGVTDGVVAKQLDKDGSWNTQKYLLKVNKPVVAFGGYKTIVIY